MSANKPDNRAESVRDAATGYAAVVLGIICFILTLALVMTAVRIVVSFTPVTSSSGTSATLTAGATTTAQGRA